jgi:TnpA family transposase
LLLCVHGLGANAGLKRMDASRHGGPSYRELAYAPRSSPVSARTSIRRLYRPAAGEPEAYPHLRHVLTRPIDWELIRQQYDEMVKYATALRIGTAETEAILRRFTRANIQHPTYKALADLGKAIKTIFLCRYLHDEALRREINDGLNVIEHWNSANDFVFFARHGELGSNRHEDHEPSCCSRC